MTGEVKIPAKRHLVSLASINNGLLMVVAKGLKTVNLIRTDIRGNVRWTVTLAGMVEWRVLSDGELAIVVPVRVDPSVSDGGAVQLFDMDGKKVRDVPWPIPRTGWDGVQELTVENGIVVADLNTGRRIHARIDPKSKTDPDDVVTVGDVSASGEGAEEVRKANYRAGLAVIGARLENWDHDREGAGKLNEKRQRRLGKLRGHKLHISGLPGYDPSAADKEVSRGDWWKPETHIGRMLSVEPDGSIWTTFGIHNPYHLSREEMNNLDDQRQIQRMGKSGIALFAPDGHMRGYMVSDCLARPASGAMYLLCGDVLVRVEPLKGK